MPNATTSLRLLRRPYQVGRVVLLLLLGLGLLWWGALSGLSVVQLGARVGGLSEFPLFVAWTGLVMAVVGLLSLVGAWRLARSVFAPQELTDD